MKTDHLKEIRWAIIGSAATAIQGCAVSPNDIDILVHDPEGVYRFAHLLSDYAPARCAYQPGDEAWQSSQELLVSADNEPNEYGYRWHFCRFIINNIKVEVAHIEPPKGFKMAKDGAGIWEAGPEIWPYIRRQAFQNYEVSVVPLEIQLETNVERGLAGRIEEIISRLKAQGYDREFLQLSLSAKNWEKMAVIFEMGN